MIGTKRGFVKQNIFKNIFPLSPLDEAKGFEEGGLA
jgi:hypothetical protein